MSDRYGIFGILQKKILTLLKQKVESRTGKNSQLVAVRLRRYTNGIVMFSSQANASLPAIVFRYPQQRHVKLLLTNENKNKANYLIKAFDQGKTLLHDEELTDFLEIMRGTTFGIVTVCNNNIYKNVSARQGEVIREFHTSYFVHIV